MMSGTSMDGIDISLVSSDGEKVIRKNNFSQLYDEHVYTLSANSINKVCKEFNLVLFWNTVIPDENGNLHIYSNLHNY